MTMSKAGQQRSRWWSRDPRRAEISERHMQQESIKCSSSLPQNITKTLSFPDIKKFYKAQSEKYFTVSRVSRSTKLQTAT